MKKLALLFIICFFLITRIYKIGDIPGSLYWDEASIGYNAYSIITTGKDEWGKSFPVHFRAFGEFKLPVYIYSVALIELFLGLNNTAVRLPAVLFSLLSIIFIYLLSTKITKKEEIGLLSAFFFSISPWMFIFSRAGYEATAGLAFFLIGLFFLLKTYDKIENLIISTFAFIFSLYSYNSFRIIIPLTLILLLGFFYNKIEKTRKSLIISIFCLLFFIISLVPIIRLFTLDQGASRLITVGVFNNGNYLNVTQKVIHNYFSHFTPSFLFTRGDANMRSQIPGFGELYWLDLLFILSGFIYVFKEVKNRKYEYFILVLILIISPIPAAITNESPHALRSITAVPFFTILASLGLVWLSKKIKKSFFIIAPSILIYFVLFFNYYKVFLTTYPNISESAWQIEYKILFQSVLKGNNSKVLVSDEYGQPYIFGLYYLKYDPNQFRQTVRYNPVNEWGFSTVESFGNFSFGKIADKKLYEFK